MFGNSHQNQAARVGAASLCFDQKIVKMVIANFAQLLGAILQSRFWGARATPTCTRSY
jgi:hypothetical protein